MEFPKEVLLEIMGMRVGDSYDSDDEYNGIVLVDGGEWVSEGKYDYRAWVFEFKEKFYMVSDSRSGSYFSDYWYGSEDWGDMEDCDEVVKVPVTTYEWRTVR